MTGADLDAMLAADDARPCGDGYVATRGAVVYSLKWGAPRALKPYPDGAGYPSLRLGGRRVAMHTLMLETFVGPCPDGMECLHADDDRENYDLRNLSWGTRRANLEDRKRNGRAPRGLTTEQIEQARALVAAGRTNAETARRFGVATSTVWKALHRAA